MFNKTILVISCCLAVIVPLSYHETCEWHPSVDNDGMIVYTRWDYVDRGDCIAHHPWKTYPDGRDHRDIHGNYPASRYARPDMEMRVRAIPGSHRHVSTAAGHHDLELSDEDTHRITIWLDCNSNFLGAYHNVAKQARGEHVMPLLE